MLARARTHWCCTIGVCCHTTLTNACCMRCQVTCYPVILYNSPQGSASADSLSSHCPGQATFHCCHLLCLTAAGTTRLWRRHQSGCTSSSTSWTDRSDKCWQGGCRQCATMPRSWTWRATTRNSHLCTNWTSSACRRQSQTGMRKYASSKRSPCLTTGNRTAGGCWISTTWRWPAWFAAIATIGT